MHAGRDLGARSPLAPDLSTAAVHVFTDLDDYDAVARGERPGHYYGRNSNSNREMLERAVAELEGAEAGVATASGMAALHGAILALVPSAFARTVVDAGGIHEASGFPFVSHDRSWAELADVVPLAVGFGERPEGFDTALDFSDGARLSTRGRDLIGGSERAFFDFAKARAR